MGEISKKVADLVLSQRKVAAFIVAVFVLVLGFGVVAYRTSALEAYKVMSEWTVYLAVGFFAGNAVTYFGKSGVGRLGNKPPEEPKK